MWFLLFSSCIYPMEIIDSFLMGVLRSGALELTGDEVKSTVEKFSWQMCSTQTACNSADSRPVEVVTVATAGYLHHLTPGPEKSFLFYLFLLQVSRHLTFHLFSFSVLCSLYCHRLCICVCHPGAAALQSVSDLSFHVFIWSPAQVQHPVFLSLCFCCGI